MNPNNGGDFVQMPMMGSSASWQQDNSVQDEVDEGFPWSWLKWCPTSRFALRKAEEDILSFVQSPISFGYVNIGHFDIFPEEPVKVWTAVINRSKKATPLVLIHGFASGLGLWALNYDGLARRNDRPIYSFDMPGFGQSSRPIFSSDPTVAEEQFIDFIEAWRKRVKLERMILVGHSMGGFLVFSYAIKYPERVAHIFLADPWGINEKPADLSMLPHIPAHQRLLVQFLDSLPLNPLWTVRVMGPMGAEFIKRVRMDLISNFLHVLDDAPSKVANYIFHCNVQKPTSGESAYHCMMITFGWAKNPLCRRLKDLHPDIPMTLLYGSRSWVDHYPVEKIREIRPNSFVGYHVLVSGHHIYADSHEAFNEIILDNCTVEQPVRPVSEPEQVPDNSPSNDPETAIESSTS